MNPRNRRVLSTAVPLAAILALSGTVLAGSASAATALVTNANDSGPGSFRQAVIDANGNPAIDGIQFTLGVGTIHLQQTVVFTGAQDLAIDGNAATLDGTNAGGEAFRATGGGDLAVSNLIVRNAPAEGIAVLVPASATGTVSVTLVNVDIVDNLGHGVLVNDQEDPLSSDPDGSAASVDVVVLNSRFIRNGYSVSDRDGLRVNEGGIGDLLITLRGSSARTNAADGIEVDERGTGHVRVSMSTSDVTGNGQFDPDDLDDGFDIDEAGEGSITGKIYQSSANDNFEEGFDFNENDAGDLRVDMEHVEASGNREEGIDYEEDDDFAGGGDLVATMTHIIANGNGADGGDAGLKIREKGTGNLRVTLDDIVTSGNDIGGTEIREDATGNLAATITNATSRNNASHGINLDENATGNLNALVNNTNLSDNGGAGIRADQQTAGVGALLLSKVTAANNTGGATTGGGVTVVTVP